MGDFSKGSFHHSPCLYSVQFSSKDFVPPMNCRWDGPDWCAHTILCFIGLCLLLHTLYKASHTLIQFRVIMSLAAARWHSILNIQFICRQFLCPKLHPVITVVFQVRPAFGQMIMFPQFCVTFFRLYGGIPEVKTEILTCMQIKGRSEKTYKCSSLENRNVCHYLFLILYLL